MIEFKNISKSYGNQEVIKDFNLTIECGTFLTIIGSSGSGKSTLLNIIGILDQKDSGIYELDGIPIEHLNEAKAEVLINDKNIQDEDLIELRRKIGYVIQGNILFPHLTVFDNIAYVLNLKKYDKKEIEKIVNEKMDMLNLSRDLKDRLPDELSGGQQQRVGIARALAASPDIILMDEPFGAVDAITRYQLQKDLKELHKKTEATIVFITHDITEALKLGTKVLVLDKGEIQQYDIPKNICSNPKNEFVKQLLKMAEM